MDDFDKQVMKDAMSGLEERKIKPNKRRMKRSDKKITENVKKDAFRNLAKGVLKKTPPGRVINIGSKVIKGVKNLSKAVKKGNFTKEDKKDIGVAGLLSATATFPLVKNIVKDKFNKKRKQQEDLATIESNMKYKKIGGSAKTEKGSTDFGMLSVKHGIDENPDETRADFIAGATKGKKPKVLKAANSKFVVQGMGAAIRGGLTKGSS